MNFNSEILHIVVPLFSPAAGRRLRAIRIAMSYTQIELGHELGCSQALIAKLEAGKIRRVGFTYARFLKVFGVQAEIILFGENLPKSEEVYRW